MRKRVNSRKLPLVLLLVHSQKQNLKLWSFENRWTEQPCNLIQSNPSTSQEKIIHWTLENYSKPQRKKDTHTGKAGWLFLGLLLETKREIWCWEKEGLSSDGSTRAVVKIAISPVSYLLCWTLLQPRVLFASPKFINRQIIAYKRARETFVGYLHIMGLF